MTLYQCRKKTFSCIKKEPAIAYIHKYAFTFITKEFYRREREREVASSLTT